MTETYVALLRGINVGGKNKLPMKDLAAIFTDVGCHGVQTYIQSGNVVFQSDAETATELSARISAEIAERFGSRIPVVLRTVKQFRDAFQRNPFLLQGVPEEALHVMFLADLPSAEQVAAPDPNRSSPDRFIIQDREIYLYLPNGVAASKLTNAYFYAKLGTVSTSRNWKTITKLLTLIDSSLL